MAYNVAFLSTRPVEAAVQKLLSMRTAMDDFAFRDRELYWLGRRLQSQSTFSNALFEKILGLRSTLRSLTTVQKLATLVA